MQDFAKTITEIRDNITTPTIDLYNVLLKHAARTVSKLLFDETLKHLESSGTYFPQIISNFFPGLKKNEFTYYAILAYCEKLRDFDSAFVGLSFFSLISSRKCLMKWRVHKSK